MAEGVLRKSGDGSYGMQTTRKCSSENYNSIGRCFKVQRDGSSRCQDLFEDLIIKSPQKFGFNCEKW